MKHYNFGSIRQFREVCKQIKMEAEYQGKDEEGKAIYNPLAVKPTLTFTGTVKLHGTNAAVVYSREHGLYAQSRERVITPLSDNAGFAFYVESNREYFEDRFGFYMAGDPSLDAIIMFGEFAGSNIQRGVGVCNLEKSFFPFQLKYVRGESESVCLPAAYFERKDKQAELKMYPIAAFPTYSIDIDFNNPEAVQNELARLTEEVERECPVAKAFGFSGIGEGIVWTADWNGKQYRFKVKGEKHSSSKVKTLASVNTDKIASCEKFAEYSVTDSRFEQGVKAVFGDDEPVVQRIGELLKWMNTDILKEEIDTLVDNGLEYKDVARYVAQTTKEKFFKLYC